VLKDGFTVKFLCLSPNDVTLVINLNQNCFRVWLDAPPLRQKWCRTLMLNA
jgi:hypothetical protein